MHNLADSWISQVPENTRAKCDTALLARVAGLLGAAESMHAWEQRLLRILYEVTPAERVAVIFTKEGFEQITAMFGEDRSTGGSPPAELSRRIISRVLSQRAPVLLGAGGGESGRHSILGVPLLAGGQLHGAMYLETANPAASFQDEHLQAMMGAGSIAAIAFDHAVSSVQAAGDAGREAHAVTSGPEGMLLGVSYPMRRVRQMIGRIAPKDSTVLILGESGTGKELAARSIHCASPRGAGNFVAVNCAALNESLLESELFGHERGSFTGAYTTKKGKLELADQGTILLDEIATLTPGLQAKLLRALEERQFERVGGTRSLCVNVRILAATNVDLEEAVRRGAFRMDLYHRLKVILLPMPPLRERKEDIGLLASEFARQFGARHGQTVTGIAADAEAALLEYHWPGNVRELRNAIEYAVVMGTSTRIEVEDLPPNLLQPDDSGDAPPLKLKDAVETARRRAVLEAFHCAGGRYSEAARILDVNPTYLSRLVRQMRLKPGLDAERRVAAAVPVDAVRAGNSATAPRSAGRYPPGCPAAPPAGSQA